MSGVTTQLHCDRNGMHQCSVPGLPLNCTAIYHYESLLGWMTDRQTHGVRRHLAGGHDVKMNEWLPHATQRVTTASTAGEEITRLARTVLYSTMHNVCQWPWSCCNRSGAQKEGVHTGYARACTCHNGCLTGCGCTAVREAGPLVCIKAGRSAQLLNLLSGGVVMMPVVFGCAYVMMVVLSAQCLMEAWVGG